LGLAFVNKLPGIYFDVFAWIRGMPIGQGGYILAQALTASVIVFVPTFIMGVMFPIGVRAFRDAAGEATVPEEAVGRMYAMNTLGAIIGSLTAGFLLVPTIGMWATLALAAGLSATLCLSLCLSQWRKVKRRALSLTTAAAMAVVCTAIYAFLPTFD